MSVRSVSVLVLVFVYGLALCTWTCVPALALRSSLSLSLSSLPPTPRLNVSVKIAGSSFPKAVLEQWIQNYTNSTAFTEEFQGPVNYTATQGDDSTLYIQQQASTSPPWAFIQVDNHITVAQRDMLLNGGMHAKGIVQMPMVLSGVSIIYNLRACGVNDTLQLDAHLVSRIFTGNITRWNDPALNNLNPQLNGCNKTITVVVRAGAPVSTTHDLTHDYLVPFQASHWNASGVQDGPDQFVSNASKVTNGKQMTDKIWQTPCSIGYSKRKTAEQAGLGSWSAALRNIAGKYVQPTTENIQAAADPRGITFPKATDSWAEFRLGQSAADNAYPASALSYFLISTNLTYMNDPVSSDAVNDFLEWYNSHDHAMDLPLGNIPINAALRAQNLDALKLITWAPYPVGPNAAKFDVLNATGSSFPNQLFSTWITKISARKDWKDAHDGVISYTASSGDDSGPAIQTQINTTPPPYAFIEIDNHITDDTFNQLKQKLGGDVLTLPIILSAVSIVYNLNVSGFAGPLKLNATIAARIFTGKITMWNDAQLVADNDGLRDHNQSIVVVVRDEQVVSTTHDLTHDYFVPFGAPDWDSKGDQDGPTQFSNNTVRVKGGKTMVDTIKNTPNSIGYSKKKTAEQGGLGGSSAALKNRAGKYVLPTTDAVMAAANDPDNLPSADGSWAQFRLGQSLNESAYPASSLACVLVARNLGYLEVGQRTALRDFLKWVFENDQSRAELPAGFVPLVDSIRQQNLDAIATLNLSDSSFWTTPSDSRNAVVVVFVLLIMVLIIGSCYYAYKYNCIRACKQYWIKQERRIKLADCDAMEGAGMLHAKYQPESSLTLEEHEVEMEDTGYDELSRRPGLDGGPTVDVDIPETEDDRQ